MRLPRDLSGNDLAQALRQLRYSITRQTGSHLRLTTEQSHNIHRSVSGRFRRFLLMWQLILKSVTISSLLSSLGQGSSRAMTTHVIAQIQGASPKVWLNESSGSVRFNDPKPDFVHI